MADKRIDELIAATEMSDNALLVVYQDGETKSLSGEKVKGYAEGAAQEEIGEKFSSMTIVTGEPDTDASYDPETNTMTIPRGKQGAAGAGSGDMIASTYDPQGKAQDIFLFSENAAKAVKPVVRTVTLTAAGWSGGSQTVTVSGVLADESAQVITPTPALSSQAAYYAAGIKATAQATNSLTFTADSTPSANLTVYVVIQGVSA